MDPASVRVWASISASGVADLAKNDDKLTKNLQESLGERVQTMLKNKGDHTLLSIVQTLFLPFIQSFHVCLHILINYYPCPIFLPNHKEMRGDSRFYSSTMLYVILTMKSILWALPGSQIPLNIWFLTDGFYSSLFLNAVISNTQLHPPAVQTCL